MDDVTQHSNRRISTILRNPSHPLHSAAKAERDRRMAKREGNDLDEISIKDLTKTIAKSTGNKNLNKALKKSKDQTKMDLAALRKKLQAEKTLTPAEIKKREEIAKAMERDNPDMPMAKKMAIATATAKKVAEEVELDEKVNTSEEEAIQIIANSIAMKDSVVKAALNAAKLDPVSVVTALKGKKTIKAMQLGNLVMGHAFGGSISKKDLMPIAKAASSAFKKSSKKESFELDEGAKEKALKALMTKALGGKRAKPGYTSAVANNGDFVVKDGGGRIVGRIKSGDYTNPLKESVELDEDVTHQTVKPPNHTKKYSGDEHAFGTGKNKPKVVTSSQADAHDKTADHHRTVADAHRAAAKKTSSMKLKHLHNTAANAHDKAAEAHNDSSHSSDGSLTKTAGHMSRAYHSTMSANDASKRARNLGTKTKRMNEETLEENKALMKDYQALKAKGKKDSQALDYLMSMPKYKRMSKDQMAKVIGDAKRKGIFKEETLQENRVDALAKDFHNRLKKAGNSDRNQNRERMATLAKAKKQGLSPIEMKQLDGKMNAVMNKMDESVNEISAKKYHAALKGREYKRDRARNSAAANQFVGKDAEAQADMAKSKDHDRKLKKMKQMGINRTARNLGEKAPKIDDAKYAAHMDRLKKPKKMSSTQKTLADIRKRAEK